MEIGTTSVWAPPRAPATPSRPEDRAAGLAWELDATGTALVDRSGVIAAANPAFRRLLGRGDGCVAGVDLHDLFAPDDVDEVLDRATPEVWCPVAARRADGFPVLAELSVSERLGGERVLRVRPRRPVLVPADGPPPPPADPARDELAHALSHDIRGRLGVVTGFLDLATDGADTTLPDREAALVARAAAATGTAQRMLERLVRFIRLGEATFRLAPTALDDVVAEAIAATDGTATVTAEPLPVVLADPPLLVECLTELLHNAAEYGGDVPSVTISARSAGGWCELRIADDGPGIPAELAEDAFGLYRQLQRRDWERGIGMGLPICRRIVDGHAGRLTLTAGEPAGTTAVVRLVVAPR